MALSNFELQLSAVQASLKPGGHSSLLYLQTIENSRQGLSKSIEGITDCLRRLLQLRLTHCVPSSAVGCTALPLALHMLGRKILFASASYPTIHDLESVKIQSDCPTYILFRAMEECRPQHDGVDGISQTISHIMGLKHIDEVTSSSGHKDDPCHDNSWSEILTTSPACYLRVALTIDLSLSQGRIPEEGDFMFEHTKLFKEDTRPGVAKLQHWRQMENSGFDRNVSRVKDGPGTTSPLPDMAGWVQNDQSLYFAQQLGLGVDS